MKRHGSNLKGQPDEQKKEENRSKKNEKSILYNQ